MTISNTVRTAGPFDGNGVSTLFPFTFKIFKPSELLAVRTDVATGVATPLVLNSDYTVVMNSDQDETPGGTATLSPALAAGQTLVLTSQLEYLQPIDITNGGGFYPAVINAALDRLTIFCQQLFSLANRSLKLPLSDVAINTELPSAAARANKLLGFDSDGKPIVAVPISGSAADVALDLASTKAQYASGTGSNLIGFIANFLGAGFRTVLDKLRDHVSIKDFYQPGDVDDTAAAQRATNSGRAVYFPAGTYRITGVTYTGRVCWYSHGDVTILSDDIVLSVQSGSRSSVRRLNLMNITAPWVINRDVNNWDSVPTVAQSNGPGYQPTVNDGDVWPTLTTAQQTQDIGPKLVFQGDASDIVVEDITGRFVSVLIYDAVNSAIRNCNFRGGKSFAGSAMFWNINGQIGSGNRIIGNTITYSSNSGAIMARNNDGEMSGNKVYFVGESGVKTYQNTAGGVDARCRRIKIDNNDVRYQYYDGIDAASNYPIDGTFDAQHQITNNNCFGGRQTGLHGDGQLCQISGNTFRQNGKDGIRGFYNQSKISDNLVVDNNRSNTNAGVHHINIEGVGNTISDNRVRTFGNLGAAIYAIGPNYAFGNTCNDGGFFFGNVGSIDSQLFGNSDAVATMSTTIPQRIRQNSTTVPALELYSDSAAVPVVRMEFHPRHNFIRNPCGGIEGYLSVAADNAEYGGMLFYGASNGILYRGMYIGSNPSIPGKVFPVLNVPNVAVTPAMIDTSSLAFWVDETGNALKLSVKYANGTTTKTATIALT